MENYKVSKLYSFEVLPRIIEEGGAYLYSSLPPEGNGGTFAIFFVHVCRDT